MSRSARRPKPKMPGDGCFLCDPVAREAAFRRAVGKVVAREVRDETSGKGAEMFTKADVMKAVEGAHVNAVEETTNNVCARISAWLMERSQSRRGDNDEHADALEEAALDIRDGEWRRTTSPQRGGSDG